MKSKPFTLIHFACISMVIIQVLFVCKNNAFSQSKKTKTDTELVVEVSKFLSRDGNITSLKNKEQYYAFNMKIELVKKNDKTILVKVDFSNAIGIEIFPNYKELDKFEYNNIIGINSHAVIVIPILILNNPTDEKNPTDLITGINKQSLKDLISSILYPDMLKKNVTLFPLFTISRADVQ